MNQIRPGMATAPISAGERPLTAGLDHRAIAQFLDLDRVGAALGLVLVVVANGLFIGSRQLWLVVPAIAVLLASLTVARRLLDEGSLLSPLALAAAGNWLVAVVVTAVLPMLWPVMAITVLMPLVLATPYLGRRLLIAAVVAAAVVAGLVSLVGLLNDDGGAIPDLEDGLELLLVVGALIAQIVPIGLIVRQNNHYQRQSLELATALNWELRRSEQELDASRRRVVLAADTERRRIERDLHDGAQQRLVAISLRLRLLESQGPDSPEVHSALTNLVMEVEQAVEEIRELAHGIYPPVLQTRGLVAALSAVARRSPLPVETDFADIGRPDEAVETALYFTALEALTNASKHAPDASVTMSLAEDTNGLTLRVSDDGPGFTVDGAVRSLGTHHMGDRLAAVGGRLEIESSPGEGTTMTATVASSPPSP